MRGTEQMRNNQKKKGWWLAGLACAVVALGFLCLLVGSSGMNLSQAWQALQGHGTAAQTRILWRIRLPRVLAAALAGAGLSLAGLIMQTCLNNPMASPGTLGVSNAAVFGANLSLLAFGGGYLSAGRGAADLALGANPFAASAMAFLFSVLSILLILGLCRIRAFSPGVVVLAGIAMGAVWTAATTILQFYATDVGLSAAVIWSFGDLGRATYGADLILFAALTASLVFFSLMAWRLNALLSGDAAARSMGVHVSALRFTALLFSSVMTAVCVSALGIIGFVGVICPHVAKKLLGQDHRFSIPCSALMGSLLLLAADTLARSIGGGTALPVGAITSLLGAPFFLGLIFSRRGESGC